MGALSSPGDPYDVLWHQFATDVKKNSGGALRTDLFIRGEVGGEEALMLAVRRGRIEVSIFTSTGLSAIVPEMSILMAPFIFDSLEQADFVLDTYLTKPIQALVEQKGLTVLGLADEGFLNVFSVSRLRIPDDVAGYRMRARQVPSSPAFLEALNADVVALTFPELIPALQTGLVQGAEAGAMTYASYGLAPVAPYYTLTRHAYSSGIYSANTSWFENLDETERAIIRRSIPSANQVRRMIRKRNAADLDAAKSRGAQVYQPTAEELALWRSSTKHAATTLVEQIGGEAQSFYDAIIEGKAAYTRTQIDGN